MTTKIAFGAAEVLGLAAAIGTALNIPWDGNRDPGDAKLIRAAYAALEVLEAEGIKFPRS
jgi:hypothetical protein